MSTSQRVAMDCTVDDVVQQDEVKTEASGQKREREADNDEVLGLDEKEDAKIIIRMKETAFELPKSYVLPAKIWRTALEEQPDVQELPLDHVPFINPEDACDSVTAMKWIIRYLNLVKGKEPITFKPEEQTEFVNQHKPKSEKQPLSELVHEQVLSFFTDLEKEKLRVMYGVIQAANYLDIPYLLQMCAMMVAKLIKGKELKDIKTAVAPDQPITPAVDAAQA